MIFSHSHGESVTVEGAQVGQKDISDSRDALLSKETLRMAPKKPAHVSGGAEFTALR
jgi:hypothetical protein